MDNEQLLHHYKYSEEYKSGFSNKGLFADLFLERYHNSLFYYKNFYDDLYEYGNNTNCEEVIYFIPGFNGTPGQVRFGFPGIMKRFGNKIYLKCLHLNEFSCKYPYWLKYNEDNLKKRRDQIVSDLYELSNIGKTIRVFASSTAFYDFLSVYPRIKNIKDQLILYWGSCAPDIISKTKWEGILSRWNGFVYNGMKWYSYPIHRYIRWINPECRDRYYWKYKEQRNTFFINDIESRFFVNGILWDYISTDCYNFLMDSSLADFRRTGEKLDMEVHILAATRDGFWEDSSPENIERTVNKFTRYERIIYRPTGHLWIVTPENIYDLIR